MRDRLIELIKQGQPEYNPLNDSCISNLADHLIANGVILPPCKVGAKVYTIILGEIYDYDIASYVVDSEGISYVNLAYMEGNNMYGKTVNIRTFNNYYYFTKEDAEKALKEKENENSKRYNT